MGGRRSSTGSALAVARVGGQGGAGPAAGRRLGLGARPGGAERVGARLAALTSRLAVQIDLDGGVNRPAMQRTEASCALFERARACARELGFDLEESAAGGASDGNLTAADGTPTLDGMGGVGAGLHTDDEYVRVDSLPQRAALLATLLAAENLRRSKCSASAEAAGATRGGGSLTPQIPTPPPTSTPPPDPPTSVPPGRISRTSSCSTCGCATWA